MDGVHLDGAGMVELVKRVVAGANGTEIDVDMVREVVVERAGDGWCAGGTGCCEGGVRADI